MTLPQICIHSNGAITDIVTCYRQINCIAFTICVATIESGLRTYANSVARDSLMYSLKVIVKQAYWRFKL